MTAPALFNVTYERRPDDPVQVALHYVTSDTQMQEVVDWVCGLRSVALDLETGGLSPFDDPIATIQVGYALGDYPTVYVIDVRCVSREALKPLLDALTDPKRRIVGQNLAFEYRFLRAKYGVKLKNCIDTQLAELILRCGLWEIKTAKKGKGKGKGSGGDGERKAYKYTSMAQLCQRYLNIEIDKDKKLRTSFASTAPGKHDMAQLVYAAGDVLYPYWIWGYQQQERDTRQLKSILDLEFKTLPLLAEAQMHGIRLDTGKWRKLWQEAEAARAKALKELDTLFWSVDGQGEMFEEAKTRPLNAQGKPLNYDSPAQVCWALGRYCAMQHWTHEVVTTPKRLKVLKEKYGLGFINKYLEKHPGAAHETQAQYAARYHEAVDAVPEWVIPEEQFCLLVSAKAEVLRLAMIRKQLPEAPVRHLLNYAAYSQRADAFGIQYLQKNVRASTGRIHASFNQAVTSTGRISTNPNLQNIPQDARYRACFVPAPGYKFVLADYSQIEPRLSAEVSNDAVYVGAFVDNDDIYCRVAQAMTGAYPDKKTKEGAIIRQMFKTIVLALAYRMGVWKLRNRLTLALEKEIMAGHIEAPTYEFTKQLLDQFLKGCAKLVEYQKRCSDLADPAHSSRPKLWDVFRQQGVTWVEAPCGRKRYFSADATSTYTEGPNAPIQGCSATITKAAAVLVQQVIDGERSVDLGGVTHCGYDAHIVNLIHDEIVWEVREDQAEAFAPLAKHLMEEAGRFWVKRVPVIVEFPKGTNGVTDCWLKEAA